MNVVYCLTQVHTWGTALPQRRQRAGPEAFGKERSARDARFPCFAGLPNAIGTPTIAGFSLRPIWPIWRALIFLAARASKRIGHSVKDILKIFTLFRAVCDLSPVPHRTTVLNADRASNAREEPDRSDRYTALPSSPCNLLEAIVEPRCELNRACGAAGSVRICSPSSKPAGRAGSRAPSPSPLDRLGSSFVPPRVRRPSRSAGSEVFIATEPSGVLRWAIGSTGGESSPTKHSSPRPHTASVAGWKPTPPPPRPPAPSAPTDGAPTNCVRYDSRTGSRPTPPAQRWWSGATRG